MSLQPFLQYSVDTLDYYFFREQHTRPWHQYVVIPKTFDTTLEAQIFFVLLCDVALQFLFTETKIQTCWCGGIRVSWQNPHLIPLWDALEHCLHRRPLYLFTQLPKLNNIHIAEWTQIHTAVHQNLERSQ